MAVSLDIIGLKWIMEGLQPFIAGNKAAATSTDAVAKAQKNLESVMASTSARIASAGDSISASQRNLAIVTRRANEQYVRAQERLSNTSKRVAQRIKEADTQVARAKAAVAAAATQSAAVQARAADTLAAKERALSRIQTQGARQVRIAQAAVKSAYTARVEAISTAEAAVQRAIRRSGEVEQQVNLRRTAANNALTAALAKHAAASAITARAVGAVTAAKNLATRATTAFGNALIAATGFSNRFAVAVRFGVGALTAFAAAFAISSAAQFETTLTKINVLTNATGDDVSRLREKILEMSESFPQSPDELGAAAYLILSSGIQNVDTAIKILDKSAQASAIGLGSVDDVARVITATLNAYGESNIDAADATDLLVAAIREGSADAPDFVTNLGRLLGIAPTLGIEFDQLVASVASLTNVGLPANQAITGLLGIMNQILSPSAEAEETLKGVGLSIEGLRQVVRDEGLIPALQAVLQAFDGNVQVIDRLFPEVRGLNAALIELRDSGAPTATILERIRNSGGVTAQSFQEVSKTFAVSANVLRNQLNVALIEFGSAILPTAISVVKDLSRFLQENREGVAKLAESFAQFIVVIGGSFISGLEAINDALSFLPDNSGVIIAAILAMGAAFVVAFGPASAAFAAVFALISLVGVLKKQLGSVTKSDLPKAVDEQQAIVTRLNELGVRDINAPGVPFPDQGRSGLPPNLPQPGSQADQKRQAEISQLQKKLEEVNTRITELERLEGENFLGGSGNESLADAIRTERQAAADELEKVEKEIKLKEIQAQFKDLAFDGDSAAKVVSALSDGIIDFSEAAELGLSAAQAGALEAQHALEASGESAFNYAKAISRVQTAMALGGQAATKFVLSLSKNALELARSAGSALFSRPTREIAKLELALVRLQIANSGAISSLERRLADFDRQAAAQDEARQARDLQRAVSEAEDPEARRSAQEALSDFNADRQRQRQRDAIQAEINKRLEAEQKIQDEIDLRNLQTTALQKQIEAADATLLSQGQLTAAASEVARVVGEQSVIVKTLSDRLGISLIPEVDAMKEAAGLASDAFKTLSGQYIGPDGAFTKGLDITTQSLLNFNAALQPSGGTTPENTPVAGQASGGFTTRPTLTVLGEHSRPELTLPLSDVRRSKELLRSIPPSLMAAITPAGRTGPSSVFGDFNVTGYVPAEMETLVVHNVRKELRRSRSGIARAGMRL